MFIFKSFIDSNGLTANGSDGGFFGMSSVVVSCGNTEQISNFPIGGVVSL